MDDDISIIMRTLGVTHKDALELMKNGLNVHYIKTGLKDELNNEINDLTTKVKSNVDAILKESKI